MSVLGLRKFKETIQFNDNVMSCVANFTCNNAPYDLIIPFEAYGIKGIQYASADFENVVTVYKEEADEDFIKGWQTEDYRLVNFTSEPILEDGSIDELATAWILANTDAIEEAKPLAEITYNGETIAQLNAGETAILKCDGLPMETDIIVKVNG